MSDTTIAPPSVLRISAADLHDAPVTGVPAHYRALLSGPAGSGASRAVMLDGAVPHDLIVVQYGDGGYSRAWLRGDSCADGVVYSLLAELPASFPARAPAIVR